MHMDHQYRALRPGPLKAFWRWITSTDWKTAVDLVVARINRLQGAVDAAVEGQNQLARDAERYCDRRIREDSKAQAATTKAEVLRMEFRLKRRLEQQLQQQLNQRVPRDPLMNRLHYLLSRSDPAAIMVFAEDVGAPVELIEQWAQGRSIPSQRHRQEIAGWVYDVRSPSPEQLAGTADMDSRGDPLILKLKKLLAQPGKVDSRAAEELGVHVRTLYKWADKTQKPDLRNRMRIAQLVYGLEAQHITDLHLEGLAYLESGSKGGEA